MNRLTVKEIVAAKPKDKEYKITVDRNLHLRIAPSGTKWWISKYVVNGRQTQYTLPKPYGQPEKANPNNDGFMTLAEAVTENSRIQALARSGIDIKVQQEQEAETKRKALIQQAEQNKTIKGLFDEWVNDGASRKDANAEIIRSFTKDVLPAIGVKPVRDVTVEHIRNLLREAASRGVNRTIVLLLKDIDQMFRWADDEPKWRRLMEDGNPARNIRIETLVADDYDLSNTRQRVLSIEELQELSSIFVNSELAYKNAANKRTAVRPILNRTQLAMWICLSTTCRIGELSKARWVNVDLELGEWRIPKKDYKSTRAKAQCDYMVFLSPFAIRQFQALKELTGHTDYCFPAGKQHMGSVDEKTMSKQIGDRQMQFKEREPLKNRKCDDTLVLAQGANGDWTPHDLRRTGSTIMQKLKIETEPRNRCLNHVVGSKIDRTYGVYDFCEEKKENWAKLGAYLDGVVFK